jgi:hypothetical protein
LPTVEDLGRNAKAKYPGAYDDVPDDELGRRIKTKYPGAYDDYADAPTSRGPLDITTPESPLGAAAYWLAAHTPEAVKYPASQAAGWLNRRLSSASAALWEPLAPAVQSIDQRLKEKYAQETGSPPPELLPQVPRMESVPAQIGKLGRAAVLGESPLPGVPAELAMDELVKRTGGEYHALTPEQADAISRASLGLPVGEVARALTGNEGISLAAQVPAMNMMNTLGGLAWKGARAATGKIPAVALKRDIGAIKTKSVRRMLAEQGEQHLELKPIQQAIASTAKANGETFEAVDSRIRDAIQRLPMDDGAMLAALPPEEQAIAASLSRFKEGQLAQDVAEKLRPGVRGAHIEAARQKALAGNPKALKRLNRYLKPSGIKVKTPQDLAKLPKKLVGDVGAIATEEGLAALKQAKGEPWWKGAKAATPKIGGVSQVKRITGNRALTTLEKEAKFAATQPGKGPLYRTMFESELRRGDFRAARRASANLFRDIADKYGVDVKPGAKVPEGHIYLDKLRLAKSGFAKDELARLGRKAVPEKVFRQADAITRTIRDSSLGEAKNLIEKGARAWKTYVLTRGGYTVRNFIDNAVSSWMFGASPRHSTLAAKAVALATGSKRVNPNEWIPELKMTLGTYIRTARRNGTLTGGFVSSEMIGAKGATNVGGKALNKWKDVNAAMENFWRANIDISSRAAGKSTAESGELVDWALGKYHPAFQSPLERKLSGYGLPWWNWIKQITKRSIRLGIERPGSVAQVASVPTAVNIAQGWTPDQVRALGPDVKASSAILRTHGLGDGVAEVFPMSAYGPTDLNRMFGAGEQGPAAFLTAPLGQSYPAYQWIVALAKDPRTLKDWTGEDVELPGAAKGLLLRYPKMSAVLGIKIAPDGVVVGPDRLNYFMRQAGPPAAALGDIGSSDPQAARRSRSFWIGLSSYLRSDAKAKQISNAVMFKALKEQVDTRRQTLFNELNREQQRKLEAPVRPGASR